MDNLDTHNISSLYKASPPDKTRQLASRLEIHYTPKHGSWLNIAEIEHINRNNNVKAVDWFFTTTDARVKLKCLYPIIKTTETTSRN